MAYALNYLVLFIALFMALLNIWNHKCTRVVIIHKKKNRRKCDLVAWVQV
jgi:hypothetical protein